MQSRSRLRVRRWPRPVRFDRGLRHLCFVRQLGSGLDRDDDGRSRRSVRRHERRSRPHASSDGRSQADGCAKTDGPQEDYAPEQSASQESPSQESAAQDVAATIEAGVGRQTRVLRERTRRDHPSIQRPSIPCPACGQARRVRDPVAQFRIELALRISGVGHVGRCGVFEIPALRSDTEFVNALV